MTVSRQDSGSARHAGDRRGSRRLGACLAASLHCAQGEASGRIVNLSRTGASIEGDKALADLLLGAGRHAAGGGRPVMMQVRFEVPAGAEAPVPVLAQARVMYVLHEQPDTYRCGLEFRLFVAGEAAFAAYLRTSATGG